PDASWRHRTPRRRRPRPAVGPDPGRGIGRAARRGAAGFGAGAAAGYAGAGRLLDRLRGRAVLDGVRGAAPADRDALTAVIARIGDLALALGEDLESLEVNPLLVNGTRIEALDAVV